MTLLGVGSFGGFGGGNTTLGRIGVGYIYTDWIPQVTYSSPKYGGFQYSAGLFQGVDVTGVFSGNANSASLSQHEQPGLQAKGSYEWGGSVAGKAWVSGLSQKVRARATDNAPVGSTVSGQAFDLGAKLNVAAFEGVLYAYSAEGSARRRSASTPPRSWVGRWKSASRRAGMCRGPTSSGSSSRASATARASLTSRPTNRRRRSLAATW